MDFNSDFRMLINGELVAGVDMMDVVNPATGEIFAQAPDCTSEQLDKAVRAARAAFPAWRDTPIEERANLIKACADKIAEHADTLGRLFTKEQGRPTNFAIEEIKGAVSAMHHTAGMRLPTEVVEDSDKQYVEKVYKPLGVVCAIAPWNFPVSLMLWKASPALLTGCTMVLKPSPFTPLVTLKIAEIIKDVLPVGVLNIICGGDALGPKMTAHPGFDKISFTGSTATGKKVMASAAADLKRITLELGGNDAAIIMPDVDIDEVAEKIFFGAFFNTAQICIATKRLYVHEDIYDALRDRLAAIAKGVKVGDGAEQGTVLGPIQNKPQYERVMNLLNDAKEKDLVMISGADVPDNGGYFVPVTIVDNPPEDERVVQEEAFGPILPMLKFNDIDDVIARANDTDYGLAGAIWTKDIETAKQVARRMETGTIWINQNLNLHRDAPFAGHKQSGFGAENGMEGLLEYTVPQVIMVAKSAA